ncbi:MAG: rhomboid family intramembrane serine protease [Planctomycetaceae bacterium]|jgi:membrane associated rhomboid family serine protease|nr:rhomboid family intramembrane serine protease [Planctomycetaceae bacterium]
MGLTDRDYFQDDYNWNQRRRRRKDSNSATMSVTMRVVIVNLFLWLANGLFFSESNFLTEILMMPAGVLFEPLCWYSFLTSGFVHSPFTFEHILLNMIGLLIFGYGATIAVGAGGAGISRAENIEWRLGRSEYFLFYIFAIIFSSVAHAIFSPSAGALGASGGVVAVIVIFAFLYPNKTILVMFLVPMPMWILGLMIVGMDFIGVIKETNSGIGYTAHLGGAAFAALYYFLLFKKNLAITGLLLKIKNLIKFKPKSNLKIFNSDKNNYEPKNYNNKNDSEFEKKLDQILDRYGEVGEVGLTKEEREFLQEASKRYRDKNAR